MHGERQERSFDNTSNDRPRGAIVAAGKVGRPLSLLEKTGFSLGDAACNIFFQTWIIFSTIFYTDVFGLAAESVAVMFLVTKIWDAAVDPVVGLIADRTETRWGKFRPYLLWFSLPFGVLGVLAFTTPGFGPTGRLVYAYVTYALLMTVYSVVNVPYAALMGVMTPDSHERTVLSSFRFFAVFFATLLVQYSLLGMVHRFGSGNAAVGWQRAMTLFSALAVALLLVAFVTTKERVRPPKGQRTPLGRDLADLFTNVPWVLVAAATLVQLIYYCMRGGALAYYFTYFVGDQEVGPFGRIPYATLLSAFLVAGTAATIVGVLLTSAISRRMGRPRPYAILMGVAGVSTAALYFLQPGQVVLMFVLQVIASFAMGPVSVLQWAIFTDAADYGEWKTGRRSTALVMAAALFALKVGVAVGGAALAWILGAYGFIANQGQTVGALAGIRLATSIYPAIFAVMAMALMLSYPLDKSRMARVESDLIEKRTQLQVD